MKRAATLLFLFCFTALGAEESFLKLSLLKKIIKPGVKGGAMTVGTPVQPLSTLSMGPAGKKAEEPPPPPPPPPTEVVGVILAADPSLRGALVLFRGEEFFLKIGEKSENGLIKVISIEEKEVVVETPEGRQTLEVKDEI